MTKHLLILLLLTGCTKWRSSTEVIRELAIIGGCYNVREMEMVVVSKLEFGLLMKLRTSDTTAYYTYNEFYRASERMDCY